MQSGYNSTVEGFWLGMLAYDFLVNVESGRRLLSPRKQSLMYRSLNSGPVELFRSRSYVTPLESMDLVWFSAFMVYFLIIK